MFFPQNKSIFVHIPKTGGSSLEFAIASKFLINKEESRIEFEAYKNFSIRGAKMNIPFGTDPNGHIHSYISEYSLFLPLKEYFSFTVLRNPFDQVRSLYNQMRKVMNIPSLEHFILADDQKSINVLDHYIDQYKYTHINDVLRVNKVFVFDRYYEAQNFVEDFFKVKIDRQKKLWQTTYTQEEFSKEMKEKFASIYHQSIELYNRFLKDKN